MEFGFLKEKRPAGRPLNFPDYQVGNGRQHTYSRLNADS
jgi:hypothetical protein